MILDMKLKILFSLAVSLGMQADPRPMAELKAMLAKRKRAYEKMEEDEKKYFDLESLENPYDDSRILHAESPEHDIKTILAGIDMEQSEIMLAAELSRQGTKVDLVLAHHPEGRALLGLGDVMDMQNSIMEACGVPINVAEKLMTPRSNEIRRGVHPANFNRPVDTARLLKINYACTHTITDNLVYQFLKKYMAGKKFNTVKDVMDHLMKLPEYQMASSAGNPPIVAVGTKESRAGKVFPTEFTGGTSGNEAIYEKLSQAGVGTILSMHMSEKHRTEAEKNHLNVIVAGHMASDSIGMNLLLDQLQKKGVKEVIPCGMFRVKRK